MFGERNKYFFENNKKKQRKTGIQIKINWKKTLKTNWKRFVLLFIAAILENSEKP